MRPTLFHWQKPSADTLVEIFAGGKQVALDASDTGAGKTYVALDTVSRLRRPFLIICPKSVKTAWTRTAEQFGVTPIGIITPQRLLYKNPYYKNQEWDLPDNAMILWDEIQQGTAGENTKTTVALGRTKVYRVPVLAMSATIADSPLKMRGLGFLLGLHDFNKSSFKRWCLAHGCYPSPFAYGKLEFSKAQRGRDAIAGIHEDIKSSMVRIKREDIPDFPEGHVIARLVDLDDKYAEEIDKLYKDLDERLKHPSCNELVARGQAREKTECLKVPAFVDLITDALAEGTSPVMFLNYHSSREALAEALAEIGINNVSQIHGRQNEEERARGIDLFQDNTNHVCIVMTQAGGAGVSLHDLNGRPRVSFITPSDKAIDMVQCLGRIHRVGGSKVVQTFILAAGTVEEKVYNNVQRKLYNISLLNDGDLAI